MTTRWGLIGASAIAREYMIDALREADGEFVSVLSRDAERGARYAQEHGIARHSTSLEAFLADPEIEAVYISTTNELHKPQTLAAARAGKHVLCEKPLALIARGCPRHGRRLQARRRRDGHEPPSAQRRHAPRDARGDQGRSHRPAAVAARVFHAVLSAAASAGLAHHTARGRRRRRARHHRARCRHAALRARRRAGRGRRRHPVRAAWRRRASRTGSWRHMRFRSGLSRSCTTASRRNMPAPASRCTAPRARCSGGT